MKCNILHESPNRLRVHLHCARMSLHEADLLEYYLRSVDGVTEVTVYDRTQDAVVRYTGQRSAVIGALASFSFAKAEVMELVPEHTSRALNREFEDKLAMTVMRRIFSKLSRPCAGTCHGRRSISARSPVARNDEVPAQGRDSAERVSRQGAASASAISQT